VGAVLAALRDGERPTDVAAWSEFTETYVRKLARANRIPDYPLRRFPQARPWMEAHFPGWPEAAKAIGALEAGLDDEEYVGGVLWLALTRHSDRAEQIRAAVTALAAWATADESTGWAARYATTEDLAADIRAILDEHLPR
jgi:hypothetical protein